MSSKQIDNIEGKEKLRESIRQIVSKRIYNMIKESMYEQYFENNDKTDNEKESEENTNKKTDNDFVVNTPELKRLVQDPKINQATLAYIAHPNMSKDAARSLFSKEVNGKREMSDETKANVYQNLRNYVSKIEENKSSRFLTIEETKSLLEKINRNKIG